MAWREFRLTVDTTVVAKCESLLELAGARSIAIRDAGDEPMFEPGPGETPLWRLVELRGLFEADADTDALAALLREALGDATVAYSVDLGDEWRGAWQQRVEARRFGTRLELVPAEETRSDAPGALRLHMGLAFGTGEHPTTALCLEWLDSHVERGVDVLDYGCGSGVLALAALKLGARFAYAVDDDAQALEATAANAELNALDAVWIGLPDALGAVEVDLVVANILAAPLEGLAGTFAACAKSGARIALSGILDAQAADVERAYAPFFEAFERTDRDGWTRVAARRKPTQA